MVSFIGFHLSKAGSGTVSIGWARLYFTFLRRPAFDGAGTRVSCCLPSIMRDLNIGATAVETDLVDRCGKPVFLSSSIAASEECIHLSQRTRLYWLVICIDVLAERCRAADLGESGALQAGERAGWRTEESEPRAKTEAVFLQSHSNKQTATSAESPGLSGPSLLTGIVMCM